MIATQATFDAPAPRATRSLLARVASAVWTALEREGQRRAAAELRRLPLTHLHVTAESAPSAVAERTGTIA